MLSSSSLSFRKCEKVETVHVPRKIGNPIHSKVHNDDNLEIQMFVTATYLKHQEINATVRPTIKNKFSFSISWRFCMNKNFFSSLFGGGVFCVILHRRDFTMISICVVIAIKI